MIGTIDIAKVGAALAERGGPDIPAVWDLRIDASDLAGDVDGAGLRHAKHQALMRAYQARYMLLPSDLPGGSIVERLRRRYDPDDMADLEALRRGLEGELITPLADEARRRVSGRRLADYAAALPAEIRSQPETALVTYLRGSPHREHVYRHFLVQSSADLLAEASASAFGVIGEFGVAQSALFRILIDEFGYGVHGKKHSVLYRAIMRDFGLPDEYNACWPLFDTAALELHNAIHFLFQNPGNFFLQVGFLLYAETAYQRSTLDHFRYLKEFHPKADARYFQEHGHIDLHHTRMIIDEVALPLAATYGDEVGTEILAGAELTRRVFDGSAAHLLDVVRAFDAAHTAGQATYGLPEDAVFGPGVTPAMAAEMDEPALLQIGGLGVVDAAAFADFPAGSHGRRLMGDYAP